MHRWCRICTAVALLWLAPLASHGGDYRFAVRGDEVLLNDRPFKVIGLRLSNALMSDDQVGELIDNLDGFKKHGLNTVSVFVMGSRFGDIKGYRRDGTLDPVYADRLGRIIEAADERGMVVLVGCLYWSTSRAKEELDDVWTQTDVNRAVSNTITWLVENDYRNVFVDIDNEGMAARAKGWSIAAMIDAAHAVDPSIMVAHNRDEPPPDNADLLLHHSPKVPGKPWIQSEGTPMNAPGGYWHDFSKRDGFYNYLRIGRYSAAMKADQLQQTVADIERHNGHMLASTYLQCGAGEGIGGPFMRPGGNGAEDAIDADIVELHPDAGVRWWLDFVAERYGPWMPPSPHVSDAN